MSATITLLDKVGEFVARRLSRTTSGYEPYAAARPELVAMTIRPADVLLVEGARSKINSAIRYLTQSTWSHSAMYVGLGAGLGERDGEPLVLVEAELGTGRDRLAAVEIRHIQHAHLPPGRIDARRPRQRDPLRLRAHRLFLRPQEHHRPDALLPAEPAGAGELAAAHDRAGLRRADAGDLLEPDRAGVRVGRLSDPAGGAPGRPREPHEKSCTSGIIRCTRRAISTFRRSSRW